jgi:hypothetical protein
MTPGEEAQEVGPERLGLARAGGHAEHLAPAVGVDRDRDRGGDRDDAPGLTDFDVGRIEPKIWPLALDRPGKEGVHTLVDLAAEPRHLALADAGRPHGLHQVVDGAGRNTMDVGLLDHSCQRLLGRAPGLEERREVAAAPQLGDAKLNSPGPSFPVAVPIAVALDQPIGAAFAVGGTGHTADFQFHQPLGGKADHLAQHAGIRAFRQQLAQGSLLVGHRGVLGSELRLATQPYPGSPR